MPRALHKANPGSRRPHHKQHAAQNARLRAALEFLTRIPVDHERAEQKSQEDDALEADRFGDLSLKLRGKPFRHVAARGTRPVDLFEDALIKDGALGSRLIFARNRAYPLLVTSLIPYTAESELAERRGLPLSSAAAGRLLLMSEIDDLDNIAQLAASGAVRRKAVRNFGHILKPSWIRSGCLSDSESEDGGSTGEHRAGLAAGAGAIGDQPEQAGGGQAAQPSATDKSGRVSLVDASLDQTRKRADSEQTVGSGSDSSTSESSLSSGEQAARRRVRDAGALVENARDLVRLYSFSLLAGDLAAAPEGLTRDLPKLEAMGVRASVIQYTAAEDRERLQQAQFVQRHTWISPGLELKLQALRTVRQALVRVREECRLQLVTAAHAWCLFEFLIWRSRINAANMKVALGACILLAVKFLEPASEGDSEALNNNNNTGGRTATGGTLHGAGSLGVQQSSSSRRPDATGGHGHSTQAHGGPMSRFGSSRGTTSIGAPSGSRFDASDAPSEAVAPGDAAPAAAASTGSRSRSSSLAGSRGGGGVARRMWRAVSGLWPSRSRVRWSTASEDRGGEAAARDATVSSATTGAHRATSGRLIPVPPAIQDGELAPGAQALDASLAAAGVSPQQVAPSLLRSVAAELSDAGLATSGFMQPFPPLAPGNSPLRRTPRLLSSIERHVGASRKEILHVEMDVFALLGFSMHLPLRVILPQLGAMRKACRPQPWDVPPQMPPDLDPRWWARRRLHEAAKRKRRPRRGKGPAGAAGREEEEEEHPAEHKGEGRALWEEVYERAAVPSMAFYQPIADADGDVSSSEDDDDDGVGAAGGVVMYDRDDEDAEAEEDAADAEAMEQEEDAAEEEEAAVRASRSRPEHHDDEEDSQSDDEADEAHHGAAPESAESGTGMKTDAATAIAGFASAASFSTEDRRARSHERTASMTGGKESRQSSGHSLHASVDQQLGSDED